MPDRTAPEESHYAELLTPRERYEAEQAKFEANRQAAERAHDYSDRWAARLTEAAIRDAQEAMKVALLINGGAAIAVLAFIGSLGSKSGISFGELNPIIRSLFWFTGGVLSSAITAACAYFANSFYGGSHLATEKTWKYPYIVETDKSKMRDRWGKGFNIAGIVFAVCALVAFIGGVLIAANGISRLITQPV